MNISPPLVGKIPTTIFAGFLGSGKTTIIASLIDQLQTAGQQVVFIKNEIGNEDVDGKIMRGKHIVTKELLNGCICCTLVGPFLSAVDELIEKTHPNRILIEASGTSDPSAIALMVSSHPKLLRDGVIAVIDVINFEGYKDISVSARKQAEFTDLIVFNKIELVDLDRKKTVVGYVRELNQFAPIIEAPKGTLSPAVVFGINTQELSTLLSQQSSEHHHLDEDHIETFTLTSPSFVDEQKLKDVLQNFPKEIIRVKGFAATSPERTLLVNKVGNRISLQVITEIPNSPVKIVCIGFRILQQQSAIENLWKTALL